MARKIATLNQENPVQTKKNLSPIERKLSDIKDMNKMNEKQRIDAAETYINLSNRLKPLNKVLDNAKNKIKNYLDSLEKDEDKEINTDIGKLVVTYREKDVYDEPGLIEYMKKDKVLAEAVKVIEQVDYKELETILYHEEISKKKMKEIAKFRHVKRTPVFNVVLPKKEK